MIVVLCKKIFYTKTFPTRTFEKGIMSCIFFSIYEILTNPLSTSDVRILISNIYVETAFAIQRTKAIIFSRVLNTPLKL